MVVVIDDDVHAAETNHFVELVAPFVYGSEFGHEGSDFEASFLHSLRERASEFCSLSRGDIGSDFLADE